MPRAFSQDIAVRVLWQLWWYELESEGVPNQIANEIANGPLAVSAGYVRQVWYRFWWWGTVETHQGRREALPAKKLTSVEHMEIIKLVTGDHRMQMNDAHAAFKDQTGIVVSYSSFLEAVAFLGLRLRVR